MAPRKKTPTPEKENIAPGVSRVTIGKGITRRSEIRMDRNITNEELKNYLLENPLPEKFGSFDGYIAEYEREAKKTLEDARLPAEPDRFYNMPGGELLPIPTIEEGAKNIFTRAGGLLEFVTSRDCQEREDPEWYAAAILSSILNIRLAIRRGDADFTAGCAVELGTLIAEAKRRGYIRGTGKKGGEAKRRILPVAELIRSLIRKNRKATSTELWKMISTDM